MIIDQSFNKNNPENLTPVMRQYYQIKKKHLDKIVLFQMGDFYEIFGDDAIKSAKILQIQLTSRSKNKKNGLPMCGIPVHALDNYLYKLVNSGDKVVICDQIGDGESNKGLIDRKIAQIITPGTIHNENIVKNDKLTFISAIAPDFNNSMIGIMFCDFSTGLLFGQSYAWDNNNIQLLDAIAVNKPAEILLPEITFKEQKDLLLPLIAQINDLFDKNDNISLEYCPEHYFMLDSCQKIIDEQYSNLLTDWQNNEIDSFKKRALGAILHYFQDTQFSQFKHIEKIKPIKETSRMYIDEATLKNLNIFDSDENGLIDLFHLLNKCITPMGTRELRLLMLNPYLDVATLNSRFDSIEELINNHHLRNKIRKSLQPFGDLERYSVRLNMPNVTLSNLVKLKNAVSNLSKFKHLISQFQSNYLVKINNQFDTLDDVNDMLSAAISDSPGLKLHNGDFFKSGYSKELDSCLELNHNVKGMLLKLENEIKQDSQISNIKINFNRQYGYFIEISKANSKNLPAYLIKRQTLTNVERYSCEKLQEIELKINNNNQYIFEIEQKLFTELIEKLVKNIKRIKKTANQIAQIDLLATLSVVSELKNYCRPHFLNNSKNCYLEINNGRHPLLEEMVDHAFIANDCLLSGDDKQVMIITGPNMGGKSTYMKQVALICYLAQIGCFVPATTINMTIFDRIFTRVGASDNIFRGKSTFMVEMSEAATILNNATNKSLIIIDELGRGTSTLDGISLAWSIIEHIVLIGAITLYSTHYHELTKISLLFPKITNSFVEISEINNNLIFNHKIKSGVANKSYGIQVARLAGLPSSVIRKSWEIYHQFTQQDLSRLDDNKKFIDDSSKDILINKKKFENKNYNLSKNKELESLKNIDLNNITPIECLQILSKFQKS